MSRRKPLIIDEQMKTLWKNDVAHYLQKLYGQAIPDPLITALLAEGVLNPRFKPKGAFLLEPGLPVAEAYYLRAGLVKLFSYDKKSGQPKIFCIWEPDSIIVLYKQFREDSANTEYYMETMRDCELVSINRFELERLYEGHVVTYVLTRLILGKIKERMLLQMDILLSTYKADRYALFEQYFPGLKGKLSNEELCSFIGISMATLTSSKSED